MKSVNVCVYTQIQIVPALKNALAKSYQLDANQVFVGNGSDEVLALAFMGYFAGGKPLAFADVTYSFYKVYAGFIWYWTEANFTQR